MEEDRFFKGLGWCAFLGLSWFLVLAFSKQLTAPGAPGIAIPIFLFLLPATAITILWYQRHNISRSFRNRSAQKRVKTVEASSKNQYAEINRQYERERASQLNALYQATPLTPPERMRATIQFNTIKMPTYETKHFEGHSVQAQTGHQTLHTVDMVLELSEEERAIVIQNDLQSFVLEDKARYTQRDLERIRYDGRQRSESYRGNSSDAMLMREISKHTEDYSVELMKEQRDFTHLGDYLIKPYTRTFSHPHEAKQYADTLKAKILPQIKEIIDSYRDHKSVQTLEF